MKEIEFNQKIILFFIRLIVPAVILFFIFRMVDWQTFFNIIYKANIKLILGAFLIESFTIFLQGSRWWILMYQDEVHQSLWKYQTINFFALFFDIFIPGKIGSDAFRLASLRDVRSYHYKISGLVLLRIQGFIITISIFCICSLYVYYRGGIPFWVVLCGGIVLLFSIAFIIILLSLFNIKLKKNIMHWGMLARLYNQFQTAVYYFKNILKKINILVFSTLISIFFIIFSCTTYAIIGAAFNMNLPFYSYLIAVTAMMIAGILPITVHGRGITEAIAIFVWHDFHVTTEQILLTCFAAYFIALLQGLLAGGILFLQKNFLKSNKLCYLNNNRK